MTKRPAFYLLPLFLLLLACSSDPLDVDVSKHQVSLSFDLRPLQRPERSDWTGLLLNAELRKLQQPAVALLPESLPAVLKENLLPSTDRLLEKVNGK